MKKLTMSLCYSLGLSFAYAQTSGVESGCLFDGRYYPAGSTYGSYTCHQGNWVKRVGTGYSRSITPFNHGTTCETTSDSGDSCEQYYTCRSPSAGESDAIEVHCKCVHTESSRALIGAGFGAEAESSARATCSYSLQSVTGGAQPDQIECSPPSVCYWHN